MIEKNKNEKNELFQKIINRKLEEVTNFEKKHKNNNSSHYNSVKTDLDPFKKPKNLNKSLEILENNISNQHQIPENKINILSILKNFESSNKKGFLDYSNYKSFLNELKLNFPEDFSIQFWKTLSLSQNKDDSYIKIDFFSEFWNALNDKFLSITKLIFILESLLAKEYSINPAHLSVKKEKMGLWSIENLIIEYKKIIGLHFEENNNNLNNGKNRYDILFEHSKYLKEKKDITYTLKYIDEVKNSTFKPKLVSKSFVPNKEKWINECFTRLYTNAKELKQKKDSKIILMKKQNESLEDCKFKPNIHEFNSTLFYKSNPINLSDIKGFDENIKRLNSARNEKEKIKQLYDEPMLKFNKNKTYYENRKTNFTQPLPFNFETKKENNENSENLLFYVDIETIPGKIGRIAVHKGDDPIELAHKFAKIYTLNSEKQEKVENLIKCYLNKFYCVNSF